MSSEPPPPMQRFEIEMAPEVEAGVAADFVNLWHTPDTIVLDFAVLRQPPYLQTDPETGVEVAIAATRFVSRIRLPPRQVWELMRALEKELTAWETETGVKIPPPA